MRSLTTHTRHSPLFPLSGQIMTVLAAVLLADISLLFHVVGWPLAVLLVLACVAALFRNGTVRMSVLRASLLAFSILAAGSLLLMPNVPGTLLCLAGLMAVSCMNDADLGRGSRWGKAWLPILFRLVSRPFMDISLIARAGKRSGEAEPAALRLFKAWWPPLGLVFIFILLFTAANPVLEEWFRYLDLAELLRIVINPVRWMFWFFVGALVWLVLRRPFIRLREPFPDLAPPSPESTFGHDLLRRSLPLLNILFLVQNGMDAAFLTNGLSLPETLTYAEYAHRGAYPLVFSALLAAVIVLAAMRPGGPAERSPRIRRLAYAWIVQNIVLTLTSIFRLHLYIDVYSLTMLRMAAFIWMGLVAMGLFLIIVRIMTGRNNGWLVNANGIILALVLLACAYTPFGTIISSYNLAHCSEVTGHGPSLDDHYLGLLGPEALPPLRAMASSERLAQPGDVYFRERLDGIIRHLEHQLETDMEDWRGWTVMRAWLMRSARHS